MKIHATSTAVIAFMFTNPAELRRLADKMESIIESIKLGESTIVKAVGDKNQTVEIRICWDQDGQA